MVFEQTYHAAEKLMRLCLILAYITSLTILLLGCSSPAEQYNEAGIYAIENSQFDIAVSEFEKAHNAEPDNIEIRLNFAKSLLYHNEPQRAIDLLLPLLQTQPRNLEARLVMAQAYWNQNKPQESEQILLELIPKEPSQEDSRIYLALAELSSWQKHFSKAIEYYQKAIAIVPDSDVAYTKLAQAYLYQEAERIQQPKADPQEFMADIKSQRQLMVKMGNLMAGGGMQLDPCKAALRKAIYLNPNNLAAHILLGTLSYQTGAYAEAELEFMEARRIAPNYGKIYIGLAIIAQQEKQWDKAARYLDQAEELLPNVPEPQVARILLLADQKEYNKAIGLSLEIIKKFGDHGKVAIYQGMIQEPEIHVSWLISQLDSTQPGATDFCSETLSALTNRPLSKDRQVWEAWLKEQMTPPTGMPTPTSNIPMPTSNMPTPTSNMPTPISN